MAGWAACGGEPWAAAVPVVSVVVAWVVWVAAGCKASVSLLPVSKWCRPPT